MFKRIVYELKESLMGKSFMFSTGALNVTYDRHNRRERQRLIKFLYHWGSQEQEQQRTLESRLGIW